MADEVITSLDQVTPEWLTQVLANSGALTQGSVAVVQVERGSGNWSESARLILSYTNGAQGTLPQRLFLKMVETELDDEFFGPSEVHYYRRDYAGLQEAPIIHCYDGAYSEEKRRYHLLLDDLSETHIEAAQKKPTLEYGLALAEGLAAMHARWWGAQRLAEAGASIHSPDHIQRFVAIAEPGANHILHHFSSELEPHWPDVIQTFYASHPQAMINRTQDDHGFTLIHGDVGHNNILVPRQADRPVYIIDRQPFDWSLTTWLGVYDLAYAMLLDWEIERRRSLEMPVLQHYHDQLIKNGVMGYPWERLYDDYRFCVAMGIYIATEYCRGGINQRWISTWLPMLHRSLTAVDDLNCSQLW